MVCIYTDIWKENVQTYTHTQTLTCHCVYVRVHVYAYIYLYVRGMRIIPFEKKERIYENQNRRRGWQTCILCVTNKYTRTKITEKKCGSNGCMHSYSNSDFVIVSTRNSKDESKKIRKTKSCANERGRSEDKEEWGKNFVFEGKERSDIPFFCHRPAGREMA